jgi:Tat protein translocase TatC
MTIGEHLEELRRRLIRALLGLAVAFVLCWVFKGKILDVLLEPHRVAVRRVLGETSDPRLAIFTYLEAIWVYMKVCGVGALLLGGPILIGQVWGFVAAGLYPRERRAVTRHLPFAFALFLVGVAFGYFLLIPKGLEMLARFHDPDLMRIEFRLDSYLSLVFVLTFSLGIIFQLPLGMLILARIGVFSARDYRRKWPWFAVIGVVAAAILTPGPDPVSQLLLWIPMLGLYEFGILLAAAAYRARRVESPSEA